MCPCSKLFQNRLVRRALQQGAQPFRCVLWAFVGIRLLCPFSLETTWSLIPSGETLTSNILTGNSFRVDTGFSAVDTPVNDYLGDHCFEGVTAPAGRGGRVMTALAVLWLAAAGRAQVLTAQMPFDIRNLPGLQ